MGRGHLGRGGRCLLRRGLGGLLFRRRAAASAAADPSAAIELALSAADGAEAATS